MARHGMPVPGTGMNGFGFTPAPAGTGALPSRAVVWNPAPWTPAPARPRPRPPRSLSAATSGKILVVAVAAGAVVPAVQTLDTTHTADADSSATTQLSSAQMALAAQNGPTARPASSAGSAISAVTTVAMSSDELESAAASGVENLSKAISVARENGPVEFGRPYTAGNDKNLNGQIAKALGLLGLPQKLAPGVRQIIMRESTGKANAVNDWDSNAAAGTPSKGLMQLIDTTFRNAVLPSLADKGIFDPVANITAGIRTMVANHGLDALQDGGLRNSSGSYVGYGGAKLPDDGLGRAD